MLENALSIHLDVRNTAGSLNGRKYCTKVKFHQTLGGGGIKQSLETISHSLSPGF